MPVGRCRPISDNGMPGGTGPSLIPIRRRAPRRLAFHWLSCVGVDAVSEDSVWRVEERGGTLKKEEAGRPFGHPASQDSEPRRGSTL